MKDLKVQNVVCVFMGENKDGGWHKELIHVALDETEARDFIDYQARNWMEHERFDECAMEHYGNGVEIRHICGDHLYDKKVSFTFRTDYAKLIFEEK